jgi:Domain of unknown function (DUF4136)
MLITEDREEHTGFTPCHARNASLLNRDRSRTPGPINREEKLMKTICVLFSCALLLMMGSIAAMGQSTQTDYDHSFNLARLKTYDFYQQSRKPGDPLAASPLNDRRIHDALDSQLKTHGFANNANGRPDFLIAYFVTTHNGLNIQDNRFGILQRMGSINVNQVTEGTIVVVFVDTLAKQEVWRGSVSGKIETKDLDKDVNKGIAKLVQKFVKDQAAKN